ncbi:serine hydrolase [Nakamurella sp. PAMC28650]|uniref:serine hydrolase domain-containing protein n=1 Tax=Nakamurella sp. PAMC28650 TaxID=2762325 RepID=UPI001C9B043A|nr:serine hydrolase domain-containing protein [Nakamurella sp. PAMC28650]
MISRKAGETSTTGTLPSAEVTKLATAAAASFKLAAAPGAVVGVRTPAGSWTQVYGEADPAANAPMTVGIHTRIGSVTKTFTGTLLLQLVQARKLSLDDPISKYEPGIPNGDRITLRMLADMTSGIFSYTQSTAFTDPFFAKPQTNFTPAELVKIGVAGSPIFEPGAKFNYSNTNTILLGLVIEKVTGQSFGQVLQQMVLDPLKLTNTTWPGDSTAIPAPFARGFTLQGDTATPSKPSDATNWSSTWGWTAGQMISNISDLLTYGRALGTGQGLLDPAVQAQRLNSFPGAAGYGLALGCAGGWVGHTGELPGYNTALYYDTTTDTTVVVQTNSDIQSGNCPEKGTTLTDDPGQAVCSAPATRIFNALAVALNHPFAMS